MDGWLKDIRVGGGDSFHSSMSTAGGAQIGLSPTSTVENSGPCNLKKIKTWERKRAARRTGESEIVDVRGKKNGCCCRSRPLSSIG